MEGTSSTKGQENSQNDRVWPNRYRHRNRNRPAIIFTATLSRKLASSPSLSSSFITNVSVGSNGARLPPTQVGVRRVRPTNRIVRDALRREHCSGGNDEQSEKSEVDLNDGLSIRKENGHCESIVDNNNEDSNDSRKTSKAVVHDVDECDGERRGTKPEKWSMVTNAVNGEECKGSSRDDGDGGGSATARKRLREETSADDVVNETWPCCRKKCKEVKNKITEGFKSSLSDMGVEHDSYGKAGVQPVVSGERTSGSDENGDRVVVTSPDGDKVDTTSVFFGEDHDDGNEKDSKSDLHPNVSPSQGTTFFPDASSHHHQEAVVYRILNADGGVGRRMTNQEKKKLKLKLRKEKREQKKLEKKRQKEEKGRNAQTPSNAATMDEQSFSEWCTSARTTIHSNKFDRGNRTTRRYRPTAFSSSEEQMHMERQRRRYYQLEISQKELEEELSELRGDGTGGKRVPAPAILSGPAAARAVGLGFLRLDQCFIGESSVGDIRGSDDGNVEMAAGFSVKKEVGAQSDIGIDLDVVVDDKLAQRWAEAIKTFGMKPAEINRSSETGIRPMAYRIVPEVWSRLRPRQSTQDRGNMLVCKGDGKYSQKITKGGKEGTSCNEHDTIDGDKGESKTLLLAKDEAEIEVEVEEGSVEDEQEQTAAIKIEEDNDDAANKELERNYSDVNGEWSYVKLREPSTPIHDDDCMAIFSHLHKDLDNVHISCGMKFGCDYLLYDGPREERHAFAGLRVIRSAAAFADINWDSSDSSRTGFSVALSKRMVRDDVLNVDLPIPSPYELAGYVRGLNTAGKLALLATVVHDCRDGKDEKDESQKVFRVALIDLALEKILTAPTHLKKMKRRWRNNQKLKGSGGDERRTTMEARKEVGKNLDKKRGGC